MPRYYESEDSDDDGGWRDASILPDVIPTPQFQDQKESPLVEDAPDRQPDDCWMLPSNSTSVEVLGQNCIHLEDIKTNTGAYMTFNSGKHQVDIWGDRSCIDEAKIYLDLIGHKINEQKHPMRRTKKWEKPAREPTEKEKRREEKRQQRENEEKRYQGLPTTPQPFTAIFCLPDEAIPLPKIIGEKEAYLNQIRASCKSFVWYLNGLNAFKIAGQDEELVDVAAGRVRNLYTKIRRSTDPTMPRSTILRLLYQPTRNIGARFNRLPKHFVPCDIYNEEDRDTYRIMEPIVGGVPSASLVQCNMLSGAVRNMDLNGTQQQQQQQQQQQPSLIDFSDNTDDNSVTGSGQQNLGTSQITESLRDLNKRNAALMEKALDEGLESLRLLDWEISMEVAFGQIYLLNYPKRDEFFTFSSEQLANTYFPHQTFYSKLAPCIGTTYNHVKGLLEYLSSSGEEYADSPRTSYVIEALQNPSLPVAPTPESGFGYRNGPVGSGGSRGEQAAAAAAAQAAAAVTWQSVLTVNTFTKEGHVGLWNCVTDNKTLVSINCTNLEGDYSWETRVNYARRLPSDYNTPQGQFVNNLRRSKDNRLVISVTPAYRPHIIKQRTKWVYAWEEYMIEVEKEEMWNLSEMDIAHSPMASLNTNRNGRNYRPQQQQLQADLAAATTQLPTDLSAFTPHGVNYYVTMSREDWRYRFTENIDLNIGMAPSWTTRDFLGTNRENTATLQRDAKAFADLMTKVLPVYYETRPTSLV